MTALPTDAVADLKKVIVRLKRQLRSALTENNRLQAELGTARDRQSASADILHTIAGAAGDAERSLIQIAETTMRLFGAPSATIHIAQGAAGRRSFASATVRNGSAPASPKRN
jgi:two-component system, NtrC family, sensor kinase